MFNTYTHFERQPEVKEISLGHSARKYPTKLMRYWITGNLMPSSSGDAEIAEIGIGRGEMKYWADNLDTSGYALWDGYDVATNPWLEKAGYSNIYFGDVTANDWKPQKQYDCLILLHFLEHFYDPEGFIDKVAPYRKAGGVIVGGMPSTPNFLISAYEQKMRKKASDFGHVSAFSAQRLIQMAGRIGCSVEFLSGGYLARIDGSVLEDQLWWLKLNAWFATYFNSVGTEIYFRFRKI